MMRMMGMLGNGWGCGYDDDDDVAAVAAAAAAAAAVACQ